MTDQILVVGAGVIGLSIALEAQSRGLSVRVIDREGPAAGASAGNAGAFAFADILPLASPRIMRQAPKWLLDPLGPLSVPVAYAPRLLPWMWRFWRASRPAQVAASTAAQTAMMRHAQGTLDGFLVRAGASNMLRREGQLQVYEGKAQFEASLDGWRARQEGGVEFRHLEGDEILAMQPGLSPRFTHATFTPGWATIDDPKLYVETLAEKFVANGGEIVIADVEALTQDGLTTGAGEIIGRVVIAAGAHSHHLARTADVRIPLETERGYNTTLPHGGIDLRQHITFPAHGFVISKLSGKLRVGGAVELGGLKAPPNYKRADAMLQKAKAFLPDLDISGGTQWMGFRPSLPDSLPAIGYLPGAPNAICAFGHGHLGLTQSTATADIVADLLTRQVPKIDMAPFSPARF
ncbi:NAD(P)/FAD-dependent oxidoreductase [Roseovarius sp. S4756]|uniref:NAD(P)/FAD-dependent oxidoreductase n=1 Tax=Roseovarius maritimus TaxID=3342637 RepID=UPI00372C796E